MQVDQTPDASKRDDPRYDRRRLVVYFLGLIAFYAAVVVVVRPGQGEVAKVALGIMFAPTVGAIAAVSSPTAASSSDDSPSMCSSRSCHPW